MDDGAALERPMLQVWRRQGLLRMEIIDLPPTRFGRADACRSFHPWLVVATWGGG